MTDRYLNQTKYFCSQDVCFFVCQHSLSSSFDIERIIHQSMSIVIKCNLNKKRRKTKVRISKKKQNKES